MAVHGAEGAVDVLYLNGTDLCLHLSDIGINAQLVRHAQRRNWHRPAGLRPPRSGRCCAGGSCKQVHPRRHQRRGAHSLYGGAGQRPRVRHRRRHQPRSRRRADGFEAVVLRRLVGREPAQDVLALPALRPVGCGNLLSTTAVTLEIKRPVAFR
ncbi:MAG: hypothetical protein WKG07_19995 [Hymenobacter sp.]